MLAERRKGVDFSRCEGVHTVIMIIFQAEYHKFLFHRYGINKHASRVEAFPALTRSVPEYVACGLQDEFTGRFACIARHLTSVYHQERLSDELKVEIIRSEVIRVGQRSKVCYGCQILDAIGVTEGRPRM